LTSFEETTATFLYLSYGVISKRKSSSADPLTERSVFIEIWSNELGWTIIFNFPSSYTPLINTVISQGLTLLLALVPVTVIMKLPLRSDL